MEKEEPLGSEEEEVEEAGREAAEIGGKPGRLAEDRGDPAFEPVLEAGGGQAEGFEEAEAELIDNAGDSVERRGLLDREGPGLDEEENPPLAEYGEADEMKDEGDPP